MELRPLSSTNSTIKSITNIWATASGLVPLGMTDIIFPTVWQASSPSTAKVLANHLSRRFSLPLDDYRYVDPTCWMDDDMQPEFIDIFTLI